MRAVLLTIFVFSAAAGCTEPPQDLLDQKLRDAGSNRDAETERRDGSVPDRGVEELCCVDSFCIGCRGRQFPAGGCGPEFCGPNPPRFECPLPTASACPDCRTLSERECVSGNYGIPGCAPLNCNGAFEGCYPADAMPLCNMDCGVWNTEESCSGSGSCHPVYEDSELCDCDQPGCCLEFAVCADGPAICNPPVGCPSPMDFCAPDYVPSYVGPECFEGCVRPEDCAP